MNVNHTVKKMKVKHDNSKYLVESARITDAYLRMQSKRVDEDAYDVGKAIGGFGRNVARATGKAAKGVANFGRGVVDGFKGGASKPAQSSERLVQSQDVGKMEQYGEKTDSGVSNSAPNASASQQSEQQSVEMEEREYPDSGDIEYTGEEEDYLMGKTDVRPSTLPPNAREEYRKTFESCGKKHICAKRVCEAMDVDGNEIKVGDYVEVIPEYGSPFNDRISKIVGNRIYLTAHRGIYIGDDMVKSDEKIIDSPAGKAKPAKTKTIHVGKRTAADEYDDFKSQIGIKSDFDEFIGNIDNANESYDEDDEDDEDEPSNEDILHEFITFLNGREPCVETRDAVVYITYDPVKNWLAYGTASNGGIIKDGHIEYDKFESMQSNLENAVDKIYSEYGMPD